MIADALLSLRPNCKWATTGDTYADIDWQDDPSLKPTEAEIEAEAARLQASAVNITYKAQRAAEYPPIGDQLDALWKGGAEAEAMLAKVQAVKQKYPKGVA